MASNLVVARGGVEFVPPISLAFWRWTLVFLILLPFTYLNLKKNSVLNQDLEPILEMSLNHLDPIKGGYKGAPKFPTFNLFDILKYTINSQNYLIDKLYLSYRLLIMYFCTHYNSETNHCS